MAKRAQDALVDLLRDQLTDYNSGGRTQGSDWIFPDLPRIEDLKKTSYPRVGVDFSVSPIWGGSSSTDFIETYTFDVIVYTFEEQEVTISATKVQDDNLGLIIGGDVKAAIRGWRDNATVNTVFTHMTITDGPALLGFYLSDRQQRIYRILLTVEAVGVTMGEGLPT